MTEEEKDGDETLADMKIATDEIVSGTGKTASPSYNELMTDNFSTSDLSARINELEHDQAEENLQLNLTTDKPPSQLLPFPELRYLNLSSNKICEEEALLAIAAWPMLIELDIYNNPLTNERSGDPPILKRFLQERLGVKVNRQKPDQAGKRVVKTTKAEIRPKHRKITDVVPKVPKLSLEEKMMIELPPQRQTRVSEQHGSSPVLRGGKSRSVLPPIPSGPQGERTQAWPNHILEEEEEEEEEDVEDQGEEEEEVEEERDDYEDDDRQGLRREPSDAFFMTQVDDQETNKNSEQTQKLSSKPASRKSFTKRRPSKTSDKEDELSKEKVVDDRYKGYELLLDIEDIEDEPGLPPPSDIQGNIRALKHTLSHQLVYRDPAVELNKVKKMVQEYRRAPMPPPKANQSYQERVDNVLEGLKHRSNGLEERLVNVLRDKKVKGQQFPDAEQLLGQIQRRYNAVRSHSMRDVKMAKDVTEKALNMLPVPNVKTK